MLRPLHAAFSQLGRRRVVHHSGLASFLRGGRTNGMRMLQLFGGGEKKGPVFFLESAMTERKEPEPDLLLRSALHEAERLIQMKDLNRDDFFDSAYSLLDSAYSLAELMLKLDAWLRRGGCLPTAWQPNKE